MRSSYSTIKKLQITLAIVLAFVAGLGIAAYFAAKDLYHTAFETGYEAGIAECYDPYD